MSEKDRHPGFTELFEGVNVCYCTVACENTEAPENRIELCILCAKEVEYSERVI